MSRNKNYFNISISVTYIFEDEIVYHFYSSNLYRYASGKGTGQDW